MFQQFVDEVKLPFSQALEVFGDLVQTAIAEYFEYGGRSLDMHYFQSPPLQNAISTMHDLLTEVQNITQRRVEVGESLKSIHFLETERLEIKIENYRQKISRLENRMESYSRKLHKYREDIAHAEAELGDTRRRLDNERSNLAESERARNIFAYLSWTPFVVIGFVITAGEVEDTKKRIRDLQYDLECRAEARDNIDAQWRKVMADMFATEEALMSTTEELREAQEYLNVQRKNVKLLSELGEKVKIVHVFLTEFQGRIYVMYDTNRTEFILSNIIKSLRDLLQFIATHWENQIAVLACEEILHQISVLFDITYSLPEFSPVEELDY